MTGAARFTGMTFTCEPAAFVTGEFAEFVPCSLRLDLEAPPTNRLFPPAERPSPARRGQRALRVKYEVSRTHGNGLEPVPTSERFEVREDRQ